MALPLSTIGIIHTLISILALIAAGIALVKTGVLNGQSGAGRAYIWLTVLSCVTSFAVMRTGHFSPAHTLSVLILLLLPIGIYAPSLRFLGRAGSYVQVIVMSTTLCLSFVPAINETLLRLPLSQPIAHAPGDAAEQPYLLVLFVLYLAGTTYQVIQLRNGHLQKSISN